MTALTLVPGARKPIRFRFLREGRDLGDRPLQTVLCLGVQGLGVADRLQGVRESGVPVMQLETAGIDFPGIPSLDQVSSAFGENVAVYGSPASCAAARPAAALAGQFSSR